MAFEHREEKCGYTVSLEVKTIGSARMPLRMALDFKWRICFLQVLFFFRCKLLPAR